MQVAQERVFVNTGLYDGTSKRRHTGPLIRVWVIDMYVYGSIDRSEPFVCTDIFIYPPILDTQDGEGDAAMMDESATVRVRLPERVRVDITRVDMAD